MHSIARVLVLRTATVGLLAAAVLLFPLPATAQVVTTGSIRGQVTDASGAPLGAALVIVTNSETGLRRDVRAADDGWYTIPLLPPGVYTVRAQLIGYRPREVTGVRVRLGERTTVGLQLEATGVELAAIEVTAEGTGIDVTEGSVMQLVTQEEIEALPSLGRDFTDFIRLSGLVAPNPEETTGGKFSIAGQRPSQTNLQIDGVDANSGFFGENRGGSRIPFSFSLESIREFQVISNGYDVEYGLYSGGVVNVITRSGTNTFEGTGYVNFRSDALTSNDFAGQSAADYEVIQYSARASGPISRDKAFFLMSLDGQRRREPQLPTTQSGFLANGDTASADSLARFQSILGSRYGIGNAAAGYAPFQTSNDVITLFGRVDVNLSDRHRLTVRHNYSDYTNGDEFNEFFDFIYGQSRAELLEDRAHSFVTELQSVVGARTFNVFRFLFADEKRPRNGNDLRPAVIVSLGTGQRAGYAGTFASFQNNLEERKFQLIDNLTHVLGRHTVKAGGMGRFTNVKNQFILSGAGEYRFASLADFDAYRPSSFTRNIGSNGNIPYSDFNVAEWALYAQDEWQVTPRLTATLGLRYDVQTYLDETARVVDAEAAFGIRTGIAPVDKNNVSPRLNVAYDLSGDGRSVLRAGVGYFYGSVPYVLGGNVQGSANPVLNLTCSGSIADGDPDAPPDVSPYGTWASSGNNNPAACAGAGGVGGVPTYTFWSPDFEYPETFKANLGYERLLGPRTRVSGDLILSQSSKLYTVRNINLRDPQFTLASEGNRLIFQPEDVFNPAGTSTDHRRNLEFGDVFVNYNDGIARSTALTLQASHQFLFPLSVRASYTYVRSYDNSSYSCCTASEGYTNPSVGAYGPNDIGKAGDDQRAWGPSDFTRNHTAVLEAAWRPIANLQITGLLRVQSGNAWTPEQGGDLNGDGIRFNDRPYIYAPDDLPLATTDPTEAAAQRARYAGFLADNKCVGDYVGRIIPRNTCRFPVFSRLDLRVSYGLPTVRGQRVELQIDAFNVLNLLSSEWGRYMGVFSANRDLVVPQSYDQASGQILYTVPSNFGLIEPIGTNLLLQGQLQLGLRYIF